MSYLDEYLIYRQLLAQWGQFSPQDKQGLIRQAMTLTKNEIARKRQDVKQARNILEEGTVGLSQDERREIGQQYESIMQQAEVYDRSTRLINDYLTYIAWLDGKGADLSGELSAFYKMTAKDKVNYLMGLFARLEKEGFFGKKKPTLIVAHASEKAYEFTV